MHTNLEVTKYIHASIGYHFFWNKLNPFDVFKRISVSLSALVRKIPLFLFSYEYLCRKRLQIESMTYKQLINQVAESRDIPKSQARELVDRLFETLDDELSNGRGVTIPGLGTFKTKTREERKQYSPHHDSYIMVPPKRVVDFTPSTNLKENLKFVETGDE